MQFEKSKQLYERSRKALAGGVSSQVRAGEWPVPLFFERGEGPYLHDVDGNKLIDYVLGQGPNIFGHAPAWLTKAVSKELGRGVIFAGQHEMEVEVAEAVQKAVPCAELVRFGSSGTEVVQAALRLARSFTGRSKFIKFEGHYHGWVDSVLYSSGSSLEAAGPYDAPNAVPGSKGMVPSTANDIVIAPWNDIEALKKIVARNKGQVAAIITEPVLCNTNCVIPRDGYMEAVRRLCDEEGIVLIFDEVITGFRLALGGAQEMLGIRPDLATYAKAVAGGYPLAMFAGKRDIMRLVEDGSTVHAGTLNTNIVAMSAAKASLAKLMENDGAAYKQLYATGRKLMDGLRTVARRHEVDLLVQGPGPVFCTSFTTAQEVTDFRSHAKSANAARYAEFRKGMLQHGVRLTARGTWFVSTAHTDREINATLDAADAVMRSL
ncbi:MAG: aspartate aminotransferase family protein [SAR202 cluster bacterium]|nr:aspartate aminotransferase family protein [SAR202 cluster bacterium]